MAPGDARKRVSPPSFESNGGKRSARKRKTTRKDVGEAGVTLRSGARKTEDCKLDSIKTGEDVSSSSFRTKRGVTPDFDNDSRSRYLKLSVLALWSCFHGRCRRRTY